MGFKHMCLLQNQLETMHLKIDTKLATPPRMWVGKGRQRHAGRMR